MAHARLHVTVLDLPLFLRLVESLSEVEDLARVNADDEFLAVVERARADLLKLRYPDAD